MSGSGDPNQAQNIPPPLEDFVVQPPSIKSLNFQKLNSSAKHLRKLQDEMKKFKPTEKPASMLRPNKSDIPPDSFSVEDEHITTDVIGPVSSEILECVPPYAPAYEEPENIKEKEFLDIIRKQDLDRFHQAEEFQRHESQLMANYYDAQIREYIQKNEIVDKRPISDALRYLSKRIAYPIDAVVPRFYKINFRCDKILKKHKKALEQMHTIQDQRAECLYQGQLQEIVAYEEYNKIPYEEVKIPRLPTNSPND